LQLVGLITLTVAFAGNSLVTLSLLPGLAGGRQPRLFRIWLRLSDALSSYGWVAVVLALLVWSFWLRRGYQLQKKEWAVRLLLVLVLLVGIGAALLPWIPAAHGAGILGFVRGDSGLPSTLAWSALVLIVATLCLNQETRDSLLGHGRTLSLVGLGLLLLELAMMTLGWSVTNR
jgi:FtsH-binding integral membrane protein